MLKRIFKPKINSDVTKIAINLQKPLRRDISSDIFFIANDLTQRKNSSLFEIKRDIFENKPIKVGFKFTRLRK